MSKKSIESSYKNASPETKDFINKATKLMKDITASKEKSRDFLVKTGIYTKNGNLRKAYR